MAKCRWLKPRLVGTIDYLERTAANNLRHPMFAGLSKKSRLSGGRAAVRLVVMPFQRVWPLHLPLEWQRDRHYQRDR